MTWYKTGTVSVTQSSNAVIGTGTSFIANSRVGDAFRGPDGEWYEVTNIASDIALSIAPSYQGEPVSGGIYSLAPMQGYVKDSADALRAATSVIASGVADMQEQVTAATEAAAAAVQAEAVAVAKADIATAAADLSTQNKESTSQDATSAGQAALRAEAARDAVVGSEEAAAASAQAAAESAEEAEIVTRGKAASGANSDITSLSGLTTALSVEQGGTGSTTGVPTLVGATASTAGAKGLVPAPAAGDQDKFLAANGAWKSVADGSGQPVGGLVIWDISEATLPAGYIPRSGQLVTRAMWPELWALVSATAITDAAWIATPLSRGKFSSGDGATTFRMPDLNGRYSDGLTPAAFLRGYGLNSAGTPGLMQLDQFQGSQLSGSTADWVPCEYTPNYAGAAAPSSAATRGLYMTSKTTPMTNGVVLLPRSDGTNGTPRIGSETRPFSSSVIWCCIGGTTAVNPGTVDIVATAAQVAAQASRIQTLEADNMVILYPGGSAQAAPVIGANTRISVPNPFPGQPILVVPEVFLTPTWGSPGWDGNAGSGSIAYGIRAGQVMPNDFIIVQTGISGIYANGAITGGLLGTGTSLASGSYRLKVYKFKGPLL